MIYLTVNQVSELLGLTSRTIRNKLYNGEYDTDNGKVLVIKSKGQGGIHYQIALENLPQEVQDRYNNAEAQKQYKAIMHYTGKQRQAADFRALVVTEYRRSGLSPVDFVSKFNTKILMIKSQNISFSDGNGNSSKTVMLQT